LAHGENLECTPIATVSETPRLVIRYDGKPVVDLARDFLDSAGATKHTHIKVAAPQDYAKPAVTDFAAGYKALAADMNVASKAALSNMFDSTIGGGSVTMPYGGATQRTPIQALAYKIPVQDADTSTCAVMAWGYNPYISSADQYAGAYLAVVESVCRAIATGASREDMYLTFQEYFERLRGEAVRWGKPLAALLGAFTAQMGLGMAAVGGKDSMSGTFEDIDVPPALISFAVTTAETGDIISPEFKKAGSRVIWLRPQLDGRGLPTTESLLANFDTITRMAKAGKILSMSTPTYGGVAEAVMKAAAGNNIGFAFDAGITTSEIFAYAYGSFIVELAEGATPIGTLLGKTTESPIISHGSAELAISEVMDISEHRLAPVYGKPFMPTSTPCETAKSDVKLWESATTKVAKPRVLIPIVPGSVGDYDAAKAFSLAGAETEIFVVQSHTAADIATSQAEFAKKLDGAHILWLPGGFSPVDTPEGGGKLMAAFLSAPVVKDAMSRFMDSEKLIGSVGDGFLALVQLGILPTGRFAPPSMSYAATGEHVSGIGASKIHSNSSPWFANAQIGEWVSLPVSHQRGTFVMDGGTFDTLMANGQIAITFDKQIDALTSPNGRIMGMLSRADRMGDGLYKNVPGNYGIDVFGAAVKYFK
ncbi:MAG: phosphoribosylformylglycinamidine synthase subunit PurQ, partial [Oscillospiraceae bacterium]|nr:phosphoribosylformylglycinamidine synthase subunit PurQ [Oscillospiraceae bacterium]